MSSMTRRPVRARRTPIVHARRTPIVRRPGFPLLPLAFSPRMSFSLDDVGGCGRRGRDASAAAGVRKGERRLEFLLTRCSMSAIRWSPPSPSVSRDTGPPPSLQEDAACTSSPSNR